MRGASFKNLGLGFIAGVIATVTVHELIKLVLVQHGFILLQPWSLEPVPPLGLPQLATDALWGGLWGAIFALVLGNVPEGSMTVSGAILGLFGPGILGTLVLRPAIRGEALLMGGDINAIWPALVIMAGFGAATAWLYGFFTAGCRLP